MEICSNVKSPAAESKRERRTSANGKTPSRADAPSAILPRGHLDIGTNERERLRAALHDGLGQLLTSISFLASSLQQNLAGRKLPEASQAAEILSLTGRAISETQALVREDGPNT